MAPIVEGYWGKQTATLDWCEDNYAVSYYVAEFWNTVSNALMLFSPAVMVSLGLKENHEKRFIYSFIALAEGREIFNTFNLGEQKLQNLIEALTITANLRRTLQSKGINSIQEIKREQKHLISM
ncbi:alkaline ceramidase 3 [Plakobranchus ocellatus]|uniref:Alkaline ceramidase n=1 Tax=Plakobranchus ocellatus TaxID=259542 RepID=A0AAV4CVI1_9GAST|nr:alkaline ceramidase 3 [Plakobranchus ocellatus]